MRSNPFGTGLIAWLVPGAGHFLAGESRKAMIFFVVLGAMFVLGLGFRGELFAFDISEPLVFLASVAQWALGRREFVRVLHPATPGSPGHEHWAALCRAAAGLVTVEFDPSIAAERVERFVDGLRLFGIGWSWAGPMSLAVPYHAGTARVPGVQYQGTLVRLSIGLEDVDDLIRDLEAGLGRL